ncbi:MAG: hypothetical protein FJW39_31490 [Acidobacteria bacterium]|nr:hypothetical protein [Acidobacteriota bacterium]
MKLSPILLLAGLGVAGFFAFTLVYSTKDAHVTLEGEIQKVRTWTPQEGASVAFVDFQVKNPSGYPFVVRSVDLLVQDAGGKQIPGAMIAEVDAARIMKYFPLLGPKYNESLKVRDKVAPKQEIDRMVSARFEFPEAELGKRKRLVVRIVEVDGNVSEVVEQR